MSFVSKGDKKVRNKVKGTSRGPGVTQPAQKDSFGKKGDGDRPGAPRNTAPASKNKTKQPVSEDANEGEYDDEPTVQSEYDPASGKRAKTVADLRSAAKKINERSMAGEASPTGSEGGQDGKHSSSKNDSGFMKGKTEGELDKKSMKKPRALANMDEDEMEDPMDENEEDSEQTKYGMTPKGQSRKKSTSLKAIKRKIAEMD